MLVTIKRSSTAHSRNGDGLIRVQVPVGSASHTAEPPVQVVLIVELNGEWEEIVLRKCERPDTESLRRILRNISIPEELITGEVKISYEREVAVVSSWMDLRFFGRLWGWHQSLSQLNWTLAFPSHPRNCVVSGYSDLARRIRGTYGVCHTPFYAGHWLRYLRWYSILLCIRPLTSSKQCT